MKVTVNDKTYDVEIHSMSPPLFVIKGEFYHMGHSLCRGVMLEILRTFFREPVMSYKSITEQQINQYFFKGSLPISKFDGVVSVIRRYDAL